jgi:NAD(P)H dehydrogenase (quinone)
MSARTVLVTGASGQLGRRVVEMLVDQGTENVIATTRMPSELADLARKGVDVRRASFDEPSTLTRAFAGAESLALISTDSSRAAAQHTQAIAAAERAGVKSVVFTSRWNADSPAAMPGWRGAQTTERVLADSHLSWTSLRNNMYAEALFDVLDLPRAVERGEIIAATRGAGVSTVTRDDCARAVVAALTSANPPEPRILDIGGPSEVRVEDLSVLLATLCGVSVRHREVSPDALRRHLIHDGVAKGDADLMVAQQQAIASGVYQGASNDLMDLTGHAPTSLESFLMLHAEDLREWARGVRAWRHVS